MDVPNNNNLAEEGSNADNDFQVHIDTNLTFNSELLAVFFERERKGKRKEENGNDGIRTQVVNGDSQATPSRYILSDKKQKLSLDYEFSDECETDLELRLSTGTYSRSQNQDYPGTTKNTTHVEDSTNLGLTGRSEHYASASKGLANSDLVIKPPNLGISQSQVLNQNKSNAYLLFNVNLLELKSRVTNQHDPDTPEAGPANSNITEPVIVQDALEAGPVNNNISKPVIVQDVPEAGPVNNNIIPEPVIVQDENVTWEITKLLTESDVKSRQNRLLIKKDKAHHIIKYLDDESRDNVAKGNAVSIPVLDEDRNTSCDLKFNQFPSTQAYVINGNWHRDIVSPRGLKLNDEIGLRWDKGNKQLVFSVLNRASDTH